MLRHCLLAIALLLSLPSIAGAENRPPVLLVSLDGLRPGDVLEAEKRGLAVPNLRRLLNEGSHAASVRGVLPTLTYPSHTTLLTGASPARHGIYSNLTFDPFAKNQQGWYWYASDIRLPTLWDAARAAGLSTANVHWPVSVGASVDINLPQIWRTGTADDRKLLTALATPGTVSALEADLGPYADGIDESIEGDENRARFAIRILETRRPQFMTVYYTALDHQQHVSGPDTPEAHAVLERIDAIVGKLVAVARKVDPRTIICIVSDHGFVPLANDVNLVGAFAEAGLIQVGEDGKVTGWEAEPWYGAGTAAIMLRDKDDAALRAKVGALLQKLKDDPRTGIAAILDQKQGTEAGGNPEAAYIVAFKPGYQMAPNPKAPLVGSSTYRGMHGYLPETPGLGATFLIAGPGIPAGRSLGEIDMRDIAPTLAGLMGFKLPKAEGKPLF